MGHKPKQTYTAPDGSVFRVEADGSLTKIKGNFGDIVGNEPPSKYQITPDGDIYRIEPDGSVTSLGNAEEHATPPPFPEFPEADKPEKKSRHLWIWAIVIFALIAIAAATVIFFLTADGPKHADQAKEASMPQQVEQVAPLKITEQEEKPESVKEFFPVITSFKNSSAEDVSPYIEITFYPDGFCGIYNNNEVESWAEVGDYYIQDDKITINVKGTPPKTCAFENNVFQYDGYRMTKGSDLKESSHFKYNMAFEDDAAQDNMLYYADGRCVLTSKQTADKTGRYYIKNKLLHVDWDNGEKEDYYYIYHDVYIRNDTVFWGQIMPDCPITGDVEEEIDEIIDY